MTQRTVTSLVVVTGLLLPAAARAADDDKKVCAESYVAAQKLKKEGELKSSREKLILCARDVCLDAVKKDCLSWLDEVNASIPSIVVEALDAEGKESLNVKVSADGNVVAEELGTQGIELDPGTHKLVFELAGQEPIEREVILRAGQKNKLIKVSWAKDAPVANEPDEDGIGFDTKDADDKEVPTASYILGGVGVVAFAATGYFWLSSESEKSDLDACKPNCPQDDVDSVKAKRLYGDIALGVGVASVAVAAYLWLGQSGGERETPAAASLDVRVTPGGAYGGVYGRF